MSAVEVDTTYRIERGIDLAAALVIGAAVAVCMIRLAFGGMPSACLALLCTGLAFAALRAVRPEPRRHSIASFALADVPDAPEELLLADEDRLAEPTVTAKGELLLDDVLAELAPDSCVVRLFDRAAMPTPGELRARIDRHLDATGRVPRAEPDASQALHEALADLRRSLH